MKFVLAILVLLVLFTEGNGNRDVRRAHHKNHELKMKQLRKTAALPQDEPAPSPMPPVSFKFPVEVDLTEVKSMLERRFAVIDTIQNQLAAIEAEVSANYDRIAFVESKATTNENEIESVRSSLGDLTSKVESKLAAQQTSIDDIKENAKALKTEVDDIKEDIKNNCCDKEEDPKCAKYRGTMSIARNGFTCMFWTESSYYNPSKYPILEENYCRNPVPASDKLPWCYTTSGGAHGGWAWCDVPSC